MESELDLITKVAKAAAEAIIDDIAPYNYEAEVTFYSDARDLPKDIRAQFQDAATFAKAGRFDRACGTWLALKSPATEKSLYLMFNLANCMAIDLPDNPGEALKLMRLAEGLVTRYNKDIDEAIKRLEKAVSNQNELARQVRAN